MRVASACVLSLLRPRASLFASLTTTAPGPKGPHPSTFTLLDRNPFDVHVYFDGGTHDAALALRDRMQLAFPWMRFHRVHERCIGPHPSPMWEADFAVSANARRWDEVTAWLAVERGELTVLIHPHSTDGGYADHTQHACWFGEPLPLRLRRPQVPGINRET